MAVFDAGGIVEPLDYDFTHFIDGYSGTIKEPADNQIVQFTRDQLAEQMLMDRTAPGLPDLAEATGRLGSADLAADEWMTRAAERLGSEEFAGAAKRTAKIYSDLCSGKPSTAALMKLPPRVRVRFYNWLKDELSPEAGAGGGSAQVIRLPSSAAG
jgi:hypothetical protein